MKRPITRLTKMISQIHEARRRGDRGQARPILPKGFAWPFGEGPNRNEPIPKRKLWRRAKTRRQGSYQLQVLDRAGGRF